MTEQDLINLGNRAIDKQGNIVYFNDALVDLLYNGTIPEGALFPEHDCDVEAFNKFSYKNFDDVYYKLPEKLKTVEERKNTWFYPEQYDAINLEEYFINILNEEKDNTETTRNRVLEELQLYKEKDFEKFLRFCIYFSDVMKEKDFVVGVGRGSSVSSYLLYLLKIHLINPLEYGLNIRDFLK